MALKDTLSMPATEFPMRAGLAQKEPVLVKKWQDIGLYEKMNANREDCQEYMLHDGPPYANGDIHCGHALNRCLKDFVIRYKNMSGFKTPFIFGWDTHGLPIEVKVTKSGVDRKKMSVAEFRTLCDKYAHTQVERQKAQIMRLGCLGDYEHPYLTLLPEYEARQIDVFASMALKGLIFKGVKPVYWSPSSESALAEAEIEYADVPARTMYVYFDLIDGKGVLPSDAKIIIWTTTPWTIPANLAITLNPRFDYGLFETEKGKFVFLVSLQEKLKEELGFEKCDLIKTFKGQDLEHVIAKHPLYNRQSLVILANFVTEESGTGCVHTAPDHGVDDFNACAKYGIKPFCPVDEHGVLRLSADDPVNGMFYEQANDKVVELLEANGHLLKEVDIVHSYPHDWRTKKPVIFRATPQWFCSIEPIRDQLLNAVKSIKWVPAWGEGKMVNMIKDRGDWCISRQRAWGVPLPIIYNEDGSPIIEESVFRHIRDLIAEFGSNVWFEREPKDLLPEGYSNPASPHGKFTKETDIMDVWFDSGSSWNGTLNERGLKYPADLYLEGNDQYRGWFNSSLILSVAYGGVSPFETCLTHGFVMDEKWQKMSKSAGNGIDPNKIAAEFGADILRMWAASVDYQGDARISERIIANNVDNYRKVRNTFKFMLGNLNGFEPSDTPDISTLSLIDRFMLADLEAVKNRAIACYERFEFSGVLNAIIPFMTGDLSAFYLDVSKDVLYCDKPSSARRKAIQYVIYTCAKQLCLLLNPILPFTMEEVYSYFPGEKKESVQLENMPKISHAFAESVLDTFNQFKALRSLVLKSLEESRAEGKIGSSSDAEIDVKSSNALLVSLLLNEGQDQLSKYFIVSRCNLSEGSEDSCEVRVSEEEVCPRCRNHVHELHQCGEERVCKRCLEAVEEKQ